MADNEQELLSGEEITEVLHHTPITTLKFDSKLTPQDRVAFRGEMKIELRAIAQAQVAKLKAMGYLSPDDVEMLKSYYERNYVKWDRQKVKKAFWEYDIDRNGNVNDKVDQLKEILTGGE